MTRTGTRDAALPLDSWEFDLVPSSRQTLTPTLPPIEESTGRSSRSEISWPADWHMPSIRGADLPTRIFQRTADYLVAEGHRQVTSDQVADFVKFRIGATKAGAEEVSGSPNGNSFVLHPLIQNREQRRKRVALGQVFMEKANLLNKWEGIVTAVDEEKGNFEATLYDLSLKNIIELADFDFEEVTFDDRALIREGASFYWYVFYHDRSDGRRSSESTLWFRRRSRRAGPDQFKVDQLKKLRDSFGWKAAGGDD